MAILVYDHNEMWEPNLLIPRQQPIGPVEIIKSSDGPTLSYLFQQNVYDLSGYVNHGSAAAGNTWRVVDGKYCIDSRGPTYDDVITIPQIADMGYTVTGGLTWIFLVRADSVTDRAGIWQQGKDDGTDAYTLFFEGASTVRWTVEHYNSGYASASCTSANWNWIACTYDTVTDALEVYVNGVQGTGATNAIPADALTGVVLMAAFYPMFDRQLDGQIAFAEFYPRAMTAAEIQRHYADPYARYKAP